MDPTALETFTEHEVDAGDIELTDHVSEKNKRKEDKSDGPRTSSKKKLIEKTSIVRWIYEFLKDWMATLLIGFLVVSYWRGSWVLLDLYSCQQPEDATLIRGDTFCFGIEYTNATRIKSGWATYAVGNSLLFIGITIMWSGAWIPQKISSEAASASVPELALSKVKTLQRIVIVYILGAATVNIWRGIWYLTDYLVLADNPLASWWTTAACGIIGAFLLFAGPSLMAPPAIFNMDGPGLKPPPMAVTILSSYYSITLPVSGKPPKTGTPIIIVDIVLSFVVLPIFVVWFWRGCWLLLDNYLWGLTLDVQDVHNSLGYGFALAIGLLFLGSDDIVQLVPSQSMLLNQVAGRVRTLILAVGTVSFWRVVWLLWDELIGGTSYWSAWVAHVLGWVGLLALGCMSCITAPPATLGVDAIAHEESADEPLFQDVPIPAEAIFFFGIGRQPRLVVPKASENIDVDECKDDQPTKPASLMERQRPEFSTFGSDRVSRADLQSVSAQILSQRNAQKRRQNQFFRSR
jgi:hypothetical protein